MKNHKELFMGRTGVTALDVADAAIKLQERGRFPL
jgi:hypothetical protein